MTKRTNIIILIVGFSLTGASAARAQGTSAPESNIFVNISAGGQVSTHTFTDSSTFLDFEETGTVAANQAVNRGGLVDVSGGYRVWRTVAVGIGLWTSWVSGAAAATAAIPGPLFFGQFKTVALTVSDLKQTDVGLDLQVTWTGAITDRIDVAVSGGPSIIHVSQQIGSITVASNTQNATASVVSQSKTTAKAGNVGVDVGYKLTGRYGAGVFVRYAGGAVNLPAVQNLKVGGVQVGGGVRLRF